METKSDLIEKLGQATIDRYDIFGERRQYLEHLENVADIYEQQKMAIETERQHVQEQAEDFEKKFGEMKNKLAVRVAIKNNIEGMRLKALLKYNEEADKHI